MRSAPATVWLLTTIWLPILMLAAVVGRAENGPTEPPPLTAAKANQLELTSDEQWTEADHIYLRGNVDIRHGDLVLQADEVRIDQKSKDAVAEGRVILQQADQRMVGVRLELNLETRLGCMWEAWGYAQPDVFFVADEAHKVGDGKYDLRGATVTSCSQPLPQWRLKASRVHYETDRYMRLWNARLEVFGVPVLYTPLFQYPVRRDRSTGFLFPAVGSNNVRGFYVSNGFFWALGRSYDATFLHDWYTSSGSALATEFRYVPSEDANGVFASSHIFDDKLGNSAAYRLTHSQRMGDTWRLGAAIDYTSSDAAERQYSTDLDRITRRSRSSHAYLERNWSRYSLGVGGSHTVTFGNLGREGTSFLLPSASFGIRDSQILGPLYAAVASDYAQIGQRGDDASPTARWQRLDLHPSIRIPLTPFPWLELVPSASYRFTYYSKSLAPPEPVTDPVTDPVTEPVIPPVATDAAYSALLAADDGLVEDPFLRRFGALGARLVGPTFQRIFLTPDSRFSDKYKHVIEPELSYSYVQADENATDAPRFDGIDSLGLGTVHQVSALLRNRLLSRRMAQEGRRTPHELFLFEVGTTYDFNLPEGNHVLPLVSNLRFVPSDNWTLTYTLSFDLQDLFFGSQTLRSTWSSDRYYTDVSFTRSRSDLSLFDEQVRSAVSAQLFGGRIQASCGLSYDILNDNLRDFGSELVYRTQCCGLGVGYNRRNFGDRNDREVRFSVTLRNIGTVFDYTFGGNRL